LDLGFQRALACPEIGLKWSLFAFYDLETVLDFAFVPEFLAATSLLEPAEVCRTELKPLLTIFGTRMRANPFSAPASIKYSIYSL
jgi:hypothetical protein